MKRLVYTPRAYVFIKDSEGNIRDVSRYVVSGSVNRRVSAVSTAEVTLRNPKRIFTTPAADGTPVFSPMDPITIYLKRLRGRPVRVFTGFLDKTDYFKLYPGTVELKASCTLKRLLYTFFDPALPYTQSFLVAHGWIPDAQSPGQWFSMNGLNDTGGANRNLNGPVLVVGDSLGVGTVPTLKSILGSANVDADVLIGRTSAQGLSVLQSKLTSGKSYSYIVFDLGTNDPTSSALQASLTSAVAAAGGIPILVPTVNGPFQTPAKNAMIKSFGGITVVDWQAASKGKLDSSGYHATPAGYRDRAQLLAASIKQNKASPDDKSDDHPASASGQGSLSDLLYATLKYIGGWKPEDIYIEALPSDLFVRLTELAKEFADDAEEVRAEFKELVKRIIGDGNYGGGGSNVDLSGIDGSVADQIYQVGKRMNAPYKHQLAAFETGLVESNMRNLPGGDADSAGWRQERASLYPDPTNVPHAAERFFNECQQLDHGQTAGELAADVQRPAAQYRGRYEGKSAEAATLLRQTQERVDGATTSGTTDSSSDDPAWSTDPLQPVTITRSEHQGGSTKTGGSEKGTRWEAIKAEANRLNDLAMGGMRYNNSRPPNDTAGYDCSSSCTKILKAAGYNIPGWPATNTIKQYLKPGVDPTGRLTFWDNDVNNTAGNSVHIFAEIDGRDWGTNRSVAPAGGPSWHTHPKAGFQPFHVDGLDDPADVPADADTGTPSGSTDGSGGSSNVMGEGAAGAFFAAINFPSMLEQAEAMALTGERALMNDKPLMPFIKQLCEAGLREFQSTPDGKFFAFYPDYFGEMFHHPPYWEINDIEVLDGGISLTDDALVTHYYVVGDTSTTGNSTLNSMFSSGIVTIFNAFLGDSIVRTQDNGQKHHTGPKPIEDKDDKRGMDMLIDRDQATAFLERYGARPLRDDMPMIRHPYFEMFLAYQRFMLAWSKQFLSTFSFTFMPELYPGGKVGFADHGLQMYIEEVTHTWDYESGFTTQANLSAPSVYGVDHVEQLPPNMVKAIVQPAKPEKQNERRNRDKGAPPKKIGGRTPQQWYDAGETPNGG
jgi:hypothetical protein